MQEKIKQLAISPRVPMIHAKNECQSNWPTLNAIFRQDENGDYYSPEDAFAFGRLMVFMFSNWNSAWQLIYSTKDQVKRFGLIKSY